MLALACVVLSTSPVAFPVFSAAVPSPLSAAVPGSRCCGVVPSRSSCSPHILRDALGVGAAVEASGSGAAVPSPGAAVLQVQSRRFVWEEEEKQQARRSRTPKQSGAIGKGKRSLSLRRAKEKGAEAVLPQPGSRNTHIAVSSTLQTGAEQREEWPCQTLLFGMPASRYPAQPRLPAGNPPEPPKTSVLGPGQPSFTPCSLPQLTPLPLGFNSFPTRSILNPISPEPRMRVPMDTQLQCDTTRPITFTPGKGDELKAKRNKGKKTPISQQIFPSFPPAGNTSPQSGFKLFPQLGYRTRTPMCCCRTVRGEHAISPPPSMSIMSQQCLKTRRCEG